MIKFDMPWPPSINHYYKRTSKTVILDKFAKEYRDSAYYLLREYKNSFTADARLAVTINLYPPDNRKRDIDNPIKAIFDSLQHAEVFPDDNQIDMLNINKRHKVNGGCVSVWVGECC